MILTFNGKFMSRGLNKVLGYESTPVDPYNPLGLPPNTVRVRTRDGNPPTKVNATTYETATLVPGTDDVYDVYKSGTNFNNLLKQSTNVSAVLGANTTGITNMSYMFTSCYYLADPPLFDTSSVTNMEGMFASCRSIRTIPLFDTSNVTNMRNMLNGCTALRSVPLFDTSKVTNMAFMLGTCTALISDVPLFDTSSVTEIQGLFYNCTALTATPLFDTSNVTNMHEMFYGCSSLTSVPLFDTSNVTDMGSMFSGCTSLTSVPLFDTSNVTNMQYMFANCVNVESGALALYQQASTQMVPPARHPYAFKNCGRDTVTGAAELAQIPSGWK